MKCLLFLFSLLFSLASYSQKIWKFKSTSWKIISLDAQGNLLSKGKERTTSKTISLTITPTPDKGDKAIIAVCPTQGTCESIGIANTDQLENGAEYYEGMNQYGRTCVVVLMKGKGILIVSYPTIQSGIEYTIEKM